MKSIPSWALFSLMCLSFSLICKADLIYSNLGPGEAVEAGSAVLGKVAATYVGAASQQNGEQVFQSGGNFAVTSLTLGMDTVDAGFFPANYAPSSIFDAYLYSDTEYTQRADDGEIIVQHQPNTPIAEIGQSLQAPKSPGLLTFNPLTPITLASGSFYWVILTPDNPNTAVVWDSNTLEVNGTVLTPEPGTFALLAFALVGLAAMRAKREAGIALNEATH